jgi:valyl-tRNA synthetase
VSPKVAARDPRTARLAEEYAPLLLKLMGAGSLAAAAPGETKPGDAAEAIFDWGAVWTPVAGAIDLKAEKDRLEKEIASLDADIARCEAKLRNPGYLAKAPGHVVDETRGRLESFKAKREAAARSFALVSGMAGGDG